MDGDRMNCNLMHAIKNGYLYSMIKYCNAFGWKFFWLDTIIMPIRCLKFYKTRKIK